MQKNTVKLWWHNSASYATNPTVQFSGKKPTAYKLIINFEDENYEYTNTINNGKTEINVAVKGEPLFLKIRNNSVIITDYKCIFSSSADSSYDVSGTLNYYTSTRVIGNKSTEAFIEAHHEYVIKEISNQLK